MELLVLLPRCHPAPPCHSPRAALAPALRPTAVTSAGPEQHQLLLFASPLPRADAAARCGASGGRLLAAAGGGGAAELRVAAAALRTLAAAAGVQEVWIGFSSNTGA